MALGKKQFCVIGLGEFGFSLAKSLSEKGAYVMGIDSSYETIEEAKKFLDQAIQFDATDAALLKEHGVFDASVVIVAIGESFEPVVLIAMELLNAKVDRVIARASNDTQESILNKIGISEVIHPERDEGIRMATSLLSSSISDFFKLSNNVGIYEIEAPKKMVGYSIKELKIRERYELELITVKRKVKKEDNENIYFSYDDHEYEVLGVLDPLTMIRNTDRLIIMGTQESLDKLVTTN